MGIDVDQRQSSQRQCRPPGFPLGRTHNSHKVSSERLDVSAVRKVGSRDYPGPDTAVFALAARAEKGILAAFRLAYAGRTALRLQEIEARDWDDLSLFRNANADPSAKSTERPPRSCPKVSPVSSAFSWTGPSTFWRSDHDLPQGRLFLLPNVLDESNAPEASLPGAALSAIRSLRHFVAESDRPAWRLLSRLLDKRALDEVHIERLDEHSDPGCLPELLAPAEAGADMGLMSDAGIPCVADPGGALVALAHDRGVKVVPTGGPSSILLALSGSGLDGQRFSFLGYLPQDRALRRAALADIDKGVRADGATRIFIETPYRNVALLDDCLSVLSPQVRLCVAASLDFGRRAHQIGLAFGLENRRLETGQRGRHFSGGPRPRPAY